MRIGEVAAAAGVSTRALRYYEDQGLLTAERTPAGQRTYDEGAVARVEWIRVLLAAGLSSRAITTFLPCAHSGVLAPEAMGELTAHRERLDAQVQDLVATRDRLDAVIAAAGHYLAGGPGGAACSAPGGTSLRGRRATAA